jgi:NB-ARC domain
MGGEVCQMAQGDVMPQQECPLPNSTHNDMSGGAHHVVQARDIHGGVHIQQPRASYSLVPRLLPPEITHFTGRAAELVELDALLVAASSRQPAAIVISAIAGTAGMGKTALAVHWAYKVRERFPDGQLYVNLHGYGPGSPLAPERALDGFLRAMNVPGQNIPEGVDAMAGYFRSLVAGRRILVVLDNAATSEQVRPLLPASPTCVVLVTSRSRLSGLVAREGAHRITLDLLSSDEAITLLRTIIGTARTDKELQEVAELAERCAHLPLALRIAAERVSTRPHLRIADLVADLNTEQDRLDTLAADDDEITVVRTVFSWSYRRLVMISVPKPPETSTIRTSLDSTASSPPASSSQLSLTPAHWTTEPATPGTPSPSSTRGPMRSGLSLPP